MINPPTLLSNILTLYTWGGIAVLLFFLFAIARFFERKSSRRSFYPLFLLPVVFFVGGALRYFVVGDFVGDPWGDVARVIGGALICGLGYFLLNLMTGGR
ncbi:MAG: hypothetical protein P8186_13455 [Anaerolineae bacterium]|jgi:hypothetical protein